MQNQIWHVLKETADDGNKCKDLSPDDVRAQNEAIKKTPVVKSKAKTMWAPKCANKNS